ncbi:hypothetical protein NDU88_003623 [Pleurodeles waltl]|uniref:Uncharacterized protein n=1 Tax=Pleurodeles waltl TaxID=8319 RepID=A0AAV7KZH9_PLEWA|nr:hypothetical protein NDU88_003623 [Pleurodeles waltl]
MENLYEEDLEGDEGYFYEEAHSSSFEQDLVHALDASVHQTEAKAITPLKHHLYRFAQQQGWLPPKGGVIEGQSNPPTKAIHAEAFEKLTASLMAEHPYSIPADPHSDEVSEDSDANSSRSSPKDDTLPRKRKVAGGLPCVLAVICFAFIDIYSEYNVPQQCMADYGLSVHRSTLQVL